jgi:hypothetical protein
MWQEVQVKLLKHLDGYKLKTVNDEICYVDYIAETEDDERKLLRVIVGPKFRASKAFVKTIEYTLEKVDKSDYGEATLMAKSFTSATKMIVKNEETFTLISPDQLHFSVTEIFRVIQDLTMELCKEMCGILPKTVEDCKCYKDGEYRCRVRRVSDDADFHFKMGWLHLLMNDFSRLIEIKREKAR